MPIAARPVDRPHISSADARSSDPVVQQRVSADAVIAIRGLTKRYGSRTVVDGLDIEVPAGVVAGFIGPNGAGKTTTLRMLLGLVRPSAGEGQVLGVPLSEPRRFLSRVGALIESPAFYPGVSGTRNLAVQAVLGGHDQAQIPALLERVGLADRGRDPYKTYSTGMKQRLGIAAALLGDPALIILDEPTNGLDPAGIHQMRELVGSLSGRGRTVLLSSHLLAEVQQICDWLVVIDRGRQVFHGATADLLAAGPDEIVLGCQHLEDVGRLQALLASRGLVATVRADHVYVALAAPAEGDHKDAVKDLLADINRRAMAEELTLVELTTTRTSLEQRYEALMAEGAR